MSRVLLNGQFLCVKLRNNGRTAENLLLLKVLHLEPSQKDGLVKKRSEAFWRWALKVMPHRRLTISMHGLMCLFLSGRSDAQHFDPRSTICLWLGRSHPNFIAKLQAYLIRGRGPGYIEHPMNKSCLSIRYVWARCNLWILRWLLRTPQSSVLFTSRLFETACV